MTNTKSTKRALLTSVMALFLCFAMLLGTTYAWFTDSVTSAGNKIVAGTLDVQLLMDADVDGTYDDISDSTSPIFGESSIAQNNNAETLWEPGKTQVAYLAIKNNGNLDLKYTVGLDVQNVSKDLYEVMEYAIVPDADANHKVTSWTSGNSVEVGTQSVSGDVSLPVGATHYFALVIHMDEEAGNEYQGGEVNFDLTVLATQMTAESDGFDNQYDEGATFGTYIELEAGADLLAAMASAEADMPLTIKLNGDVEWPTAGHGGEDDVTPASSILIDGNGYTITATGSGVTALGDTEAPMTLKNVKIADKSVSYAENAWEFSYLEMGGKVLNCVDVDFVDPIMVESGKASFTNCTFVGYEDTTNNIKMNGVWMANGDATFSNCTFTGTRGMKICDMYAPEIGTVVIDGCTFVGLTQKPGVAIDNRGENDVSTTEGMTVIIKNSTFINCQPGDQGLYIYETDNTVPTVENNTVLNANEVAEGLYYDTANKTFTIASKAGLMSLNDQLAVVAPSEANIQKVNLACDVDLAGETWTPINKMWVNFNGNGHTISNVNAGFDSTGRRSGFWGYAGAVSINDLTLHNVTVAGSQAGTFAGAADGLKINNCVLSGTNTVTYVDGVEDWNGIGAITGVLTNSDINVTIADGAKVQLIKEGFTTDSGCTFQDNLTGYIQANKGTVVNNGTVKVIDLTITTADELFAFANDVNVNGNSYLGKTVALVADIDLNNQAWTPIGQTGSTEFKGTFDGQGHTIKNLNVDSSAQTGKHYSSGLFGWVEGRVTIKNVNIDGATVKGNHNVGALLGYTYSAQISNCHVANATIGCIHANDDACGDKAGGIVGYAGNESRFTDCSVSDSTVTAGRDAGQMIGCGYNVSVSNCSATNVTVTAGGDCTGANINESVIGRVM